MQVIPYVPEPIQFFPYDEQHAVAADTVAQFLTEELSDVVIEHIGSTAIPNEPGKNIISLLIVTEHDFAPLLAQLAAYGWQENPSPTWVSADLPMRMGRVVVDTIQYNIHLHITKANTKHHRQSIFFRDYMRTHPELQQEYATIKQVAVKSGKTDTASYNQAKDPFIKRILDLMPQDA